MEHTLQPCLWFCVLLLFLRRKRKNIDVCKVGRFKDTILQKDVEWNYFEIIIGVMSLY